MDAKKFRKILKAGENINVEFKRGTEGAEIDNI